MSPLADLEQWEFGFLTEKLSALTTSTRLIGEVMVFAVETSSKADAVIDMLLVSLSLHAEDSSTSHTLALLYVLNDILCNAQTSYLSPITHRLLEFCLGLRTRASSPHIGRLSRINFVSAVLNTILMWERRFISSPVANALQVCIFFFLSNFPNRVCTVCSQAQTRRKMNPCKWTEKLFFLLSSVGFSVELDSDDTSVELGSVEVADGFGGAFGRIKQHRSGSARLAVCRLNKEKERRRTEKNNTKQ